MAAYQTAIMDVRVGPTRRMDQVILVVVIRCTHPVRDQRVTAVSQDRRGQKVFKDLREYAVRLVLREKKD
jgi:hypothetical protein